MFNVVSRDIIDAIGLSRSELDEKWLAEFGRQTAIIGVQNMFRNTRHFSICTIENAVEATGRKLPRNVHQALRPLHCVDWNAMPKDVQEKTLALCAYLLQPDDS